jgi:hypothetical protein
LILLLENLRKRPSMFGLDGSFGEYIAFLSGYEEASAIGPLAGFREYVATTPGVRRNLGWPIMIAQIAGVGSGQMGWHDLGVYDNEQAVKVLFDKLQSFAEGQ